MSARPPRPVAASPAQRVADALLKLAPSVPALTGARRVAGLPCPAFEVLLPCGTAVVVEVREARPKPPRRASKPEPRRTYVITATHDDDGWWTLTSPNLPARYGFRGSARQLEDAEEEARRRIAHLLHAPMNSFDLEIEAVFNASRLDEMKRDARAGATG